MTISGRQLIGVVEDDPVMGGSLSHRLELEGYRVTWWQTGKAALAGIEAERPDLIVCDIRLPDMDGEEIFLGMQPKNGELPFLFVTGFGQIEQAVRLTRAGAIDYVSKPYALRDLLDRIPRLIGSRPDASGILGQSEAMRQVEALLRQVADIDSTLLLSGESGAGKEVAARFVHQISNRASAPFMAVNCAAIPADLIESELFGHERGAFTGAHARHLGFVERAAGGTLFLDEIGDLPLPMQAKLLRLLQDRSYSRVGGEAVLYSDARLVAATNVDLERAVKDGRFRQDLYFRINVIPVEIPPLRVRLDDVLPLARQFLQEFSLSFGRELHGFSEAAERALTEHDWPGNIRELRNRIERAAALAASSRVGAEFLFPNRQADHGAGPNRLSLSEARDKAERLQIASALQQAGGRIHEAAKLLGIGRSTLFEKMRKLNIHSDSGN